MRWNLGVAWEWGHLALVLLAQRVVTFIYVQIVSRLVPTKALECFICSHTFIIPLRNEGRLTESSKFLYTSWLKVSRPRKKKEVVSKCCSWLSCTRCTSLQTYLWVQHRHLEQQSFPSHLQHPECLQRWLEQWLPGLVLVSPARPTCTMSLLQWSEGTECYYPAKN